jgi:hypothetical protein
VKHRWSAPERTEIAFRWVGEGRGRRRRHLSRPAPARARTAAILEASGRRRGRARLAGAPCPCAGPTRWYDGFWGRLAGVVVDGTTQERRGAGALGLGRDGARTPSPNLSRRCERRRQERDRNCRRWTEPALGDRVAPLDDPLFGLGRRKLEAGDDAVAVGVQEPLSRCGVRARRVPARLAWRANFPCEHHRHRRNNSQRRHCHARA